MEFFKAYEEMKNGKIFQCENEGVQYRLVFVLRSWRGQSEETWELQSKYSYSNRWSGESCTNKMLNGEWTEVSDAPK